MSAPVASVSNFASPGFSPACCVYPPTPLTQITSNCLVNGVPILTVGTLYSVRNNVNFCNQFCPPDVLIVGGASNSLAGNKMKAKLGDVVGNMGGRIVGAPSNLLIL